MRSTANLRAKILDFTGLDSSRIWIFPEAEFSCPEGIPRKLESSDLSREILSREIWCRNTRLRAEESRRDAYFQGGVAARL